MEAMSQRMPRAERVSALRGGSTGLGGAVVQSAALIAPAVLLIVLIWLIMRRGSTGKTGRTEQATRELYQRIKRK